MEPKPTLKALPKVFSHADKNVRAEASNLAVELYRWLREAMKTLFWNDLKPVQQADLEKLFESVKSEPSPKQERLLRSQQAKVEAIAAAGEDEPEAEDEAEEAEAEVVDLAEPKDVIGKIPSDFHDNLASSKWKDRKDALDALYEMVNVDRIKEGHFDEVIQGLAKSMKDANVAVVTVAANCVDALAKGLRKSFARYRGRIMAPMLERLKEKKQAVTDALGQALDSTFASSGFSDCLEDILEFLKHKNPQVKAETLKFLIRCLKTTREAPSKPETKSIADAATKLLTDSVEATRSGGAEVLGTLMKIMGERAMGPYMEGLDDIRKTKIKEFFDAAQVRAKDKPKPVAPPPKAAPPTQKRPAAKKPAQGLKPPVKRASTPQSEKPKSVYALESPQPKAAPAAGGRAIPSKLGSFPKSGLAAPSAGLKKKLAGPTPSVPSPRRNISSPTPYEEAVPAPKTGRGLAGRPLAKPVTAPSEPPPPSAPPGLASAERAELEDLRAENERFRRTTDDLRAEKSKLTSQIHELQNHNAQLIEDHTRDVLSIKAKETQLVRARSDAEAAEGLVQRQEREMERLKRELSRSVREQSPLAASPDDQIYRDSASSNGPHNPPPSYHSLQSHHRPVTDRHDSARTESRQASFQRAKGYTGGNGSPSEEKENGSLDDGARKGLKDEGMGAGVDGNGQTGESWKRAAEVTSQLKARIELMKVFSHPYLKP